MIFQPGHPKNPLEKTGDGKSGIGPFEQAEALPPIRTAARQGRRALPTGFLEAGTTGSGLIGISGLISQIVCQRQEPAFLHYS
jgi:hypothetical protein